MGIHETLKMASYTFNIIAARLPKSDKGVISSGHYFKLFVNSGNDEVHTSKKINNYGEPSFIISWCFWNEFTLSADTFGDHPKFHEIKLEVKDGGWYGNDDDADDVEVGTYYFKIKDILEFKKDRYLKKHQLMKNDKAVEGDIYIKV